MNELTTKEQNALVIPESTKELIQAGVSKNTLAAYRRALKNLDAWLSAAARELSDNVLAAHITELHQLGKSPSTIAQVVAAVRWAAKNHSRPDAVGVITERSLAGIRRQGKERGRGQVDGLAWRDVDRICGNAERDGGAAGLRDSAMIQLMSDCLLRISEVVAVDVEDIRDNDSHYTLKMRASKTDQEGSGADLYVGDDTIEAIEEYKKAAGIDRGALFRRIRRGGNVTSERLTVVGARERIKKWAAATTRTKDLHVSGHSMRIGSAIDLAKGKATVVEMQTAGRWRDPKMPAHYASAELAKRGPIARIKYGKSD